MRILFHGYSPGTPAGMGIVGAELCRRMAGYGHEVVWVAPNGVRREWNGCEVIPTPSVGETGMMDILSRTLAQRDPDVYMTCLNYHALGGSIIQVLNQNYMNHGNEVPVVLHMPTESEEPPPGFADRVINDHLNPVHFVPFTEPTYRQHESEEWCRTYIPHGVQDVYRGHPVNAGLLRQQFPDISEDTKIVSVNAGNERRKNLDRWLEAAGLIKRDYGGDVRFAMHSSPQPKRGDPLWGGWELPRIAQAEGLEPGRDIVWTKDYPMQNVPPQRIDHIYNDSTLYLSMSGGEGFGLPVAEALSRRLPCVLTDHDTHRYVAGEGARYVECDGSTRMRTGDLIKLPDPENAAIQVVDLLESEDERQEMADFGQDHVEDFTWDRAASMMIDYLQTEVVE